MQRRPESHHGSGVVTGGGHDQDFPLHVVTGDLDEREVPDVPGQTFQKAAARGHLGGAGLGDQPRRFDLRGSIELKHIGVHPLQGNVLALPGFAV